MLQESTRRSATFVMLLCASLGFQSPATLAGSGPGPVPALSAAQGSALRARPALVLPPDVIGKSAVNVTTTEAAEAVQVVGDLAKTVVVVTGQPQYVVFIDMLMRAAALFIAWFIRPKERKPKA